MDKATRGILLEEEAKSPSFYAFFIGIDIIGMRFIDMYNTDLTF